MLLLGMEKTDLDIPQRMTVPEAATQLKVATSTIYNAIRLKRLKCTHKRNYGGVGTTAIINRDDLDAFRYAWMVDGKMKRGRPSKKEATP
jgi:excisionase family DNA binding protein